MSLLSLLILSLSLTAEAQSSGLSSAVERAAKAYDVDAMELIAIAHLESSGGRFLGPKRNSDGSEDIGVFQINSVHWHTTCKAYDVFTLEGNAMCAAKILRGHKKFKDIDPHWKGRYHSRTPARKAAYAEKLEQKLREMEGGQ
jgi:hypothetical protein